MFKTLAAMPRERLVGGFSRGQIGLSLREGQARYRSFHSDHRKKPQNSDIRPVPFFWCRQVDGTGRYKRENGEARTLTT